MEKVIKFLKGERIYLRPVTKDDLDWLYYHTMNDQEGRRLTGTQAVYSQQGIQNWFDRNSTDDSRMDLIICLQEGNQRIGDIAMMDIDHLNRNAIVRIAIFEGDKLGKGYGTEAMSLLLEYGFEVLNLHRVGLDVFAFNTRGIKSYEKLGFQQEGVIRDQLYYDGEYHDSILMGVMKDEFLKN
ncbi:GNAT family N-acetyltransferase [Pseudalkalibacillus berkeleyi]|uniref:GNAT family N-acetyltransferase n=1 Tax=Pseudalkalibacillus berkeleyi TaxID=1069813 RepID=A0ABS9GXJ7_9BACL|nr:GNAT family protein [Pseudalkalibacillus berkeleyi]MCF6136308.1 GNAT family N-acetyltransferase [Pseudalkalibacillus berkeleyi]